MGANLVKIPKVSKTRSYFTQRSRIKTATDRQSTARKRSLSEKT